jgi:D-glycero-D-manno-heptose 1,7-bisphosphate phosphatase
VQPPKALDLPVESRFPTVSGYLLLTVANSNILPNCFGYYVVMNETKAKIRPVVFLDRDGTLNMEAGYIREVDNLVLIEGAAQAVKRLNGANVAAVLVTNQTGAARGYYPETHIHALNDRLSHLLELEGAYLDAVYYCPHLAEGTVSEYSFACQCRKPEIGLVKRAFAEHSDYDHKRSFVVGDKSTDVELARNCGAKAVLVTTGYGQAVVKGEYQWPVMPDFQCDSIVEAVDWILSQIG